MADRPIIFSAPMIRALLDGRKSQTRRVLKPQPGPGLVRNGAQVASDCRLPYAVGDRLWVREAFALVDGDQGRAVAYRADCEGQSDRWRSPIHMFRWQSRLTLTVTEVRVQRLQEISEDDARAEGVMPEFEINIADFMHNRNFDFRAASTYRLGFKHIWHSIHGPDAWDANPWICALTFTVERRNIDAKEG